MNCRGWLGSPEAGVTLISAMISVALVCLTAAVYFTGVNLNQRAVRTMTSRFDYLAFEDAIRTTLSSYVSVGVGNGTIRCAAPQSDLKKFYDMDNPLLAEPPGGYIFKYYTESGQSPNGRCTQAAISTAWSRQQLYFCLKVSNEIERAANPTSKHIDAGIVEVRVDLLDFLTETALSCPAFQSATMSPNLKTIYPGTRVFYTMHWVDKAPDGSSRQLQRSAVLFSTPIVNAP